MAGPFQHTLLAETLQDKLAEAEQGARDAALLVSEMEEAVLEKEQSMVEIEEQVRILCRLGSTPPALPHPAEALWSCSLYTLTCTRQES